VHPSGETEKLGTVGRDAIRTFMAERAGQVGLSVADGGHLSGPDDLVHGVRQSGTSVSKTDQAGKVTAYGYDALGRLTSVTQDAVTGGPNLLTQYGYDEVGNRISQTDANSHTTTYSYDQLGRRIGRSLPAGQSESYIYDSAGNLKSKTDFNGKTTTYAYDTSNRLLSKTPDTSFNAPPVTFTYFANGLRQTLSDVSGTTTYGYDNRNRLTSKQTPFGTLSYTYDGAGNLLTLASSNTNGASLTYTYDVLNRLSTVTDNRLLAQGAASGVTTYNYDTVGNLQNFVYPNGLTHAYSYDPLNRLTQMGSSKNGAAISNYAYTLGSAGNRTAVTELSGRSVGYGYDSLYRLTSETVTSDPNNKNGAISYTYDAVGNRKTLNSTLPPAGSNSYTYDADDRLSTDQYDANGNTVLSAGVSDAYDFENHLIQKGGVILAYDGDGNRVSDTVGGVTTNYLVDTMNPTGYAQVVDELQNGTVSRTYSYGLERIDEDQNLNGTWTASFYGYDGHGSVRQLTNPAGVRTDSYDYDAFGNLINSTGSTPNNYLFAGEQYDPAIGLYYNRARYLNTTTGRYWSMDTDEGSDGDPVSLHKYLYTGANPVDRTDSSGNDFDLVSIGVAEVVGERIDSMSIWYGIAALGFVIANFTSTKTDDDDPRYPNRMRVQLQEGLQNTFYGRSAHNTSAVGVTVFQMREAMQNLFEDAQDDTSFGRNKFPFAVLQRWLFSAVISLSIRLGTFPPGGIPIPKPNFIQETTKYRGKEYRLDMDNLAGWNLRQ